MSSRTRLLECGPCGRRYRATIAAIKAGARCTRCGARDYLGVDSTPLPDGPGPIYELAPKPQPRPAPAKSAKTPAEIRMLYLKKRHRIVQLRRKYGVDFKE